MEDARVAEVFHDVRAVHIRVAHDLNAGFERR
jgi:hypothetical protein